MVQGPHCHHRLMLYDDRYDGKTAAAFIYKELVYTDKQKPKLKTMGKKGTDGIPPPQKKTKTRESTNTQKTLNLTQQ